MGTGYSIWRTYYNEKRNILGSAEIVHNYLFNTLNSISDKTKEDAEILTRFFKDLKTASAHHDMGSAIKQALILGQEVASIPWLDFTLGGQQGGILFEKELLKLFQGYVDENTGEILVQNLGQQTAQAYIELGKDSVEEAIEAIATDLNKGLEQSIEKLKKDIVSNDELHTGHPHGYSLKVGAKRMGKIDVMAGENAQLNIEFEGKPNAEFAKAMNLLKTSAFSVKSYKSAGEVHLGRTAARKAISAVTEYVAQKSGNENARWSGVFNYFHPQYGANKKKGEKPTDVTRLFEHYNHMHRVFELTGIGLRYEDLDDLYKVDFLLINRAGQEGIVVYSTQDLIHQVENGGRYSIY